MSRLSNTESDRNTHLKNIDAEWLTPASAAKFMETTPKALESRRRHGTGPRFSRIGRMVRYRKSDIEQWLIDASSEVLQ